MQQQTLPADSEGTAHVDRNLLSAKVPADYYQLTKKDKIMSIKNITVAAALLVAAGAALAEAPYPPETAFVSTQTRADVKAELQRARANGEIAVRNEYPIVRQASAHLSRQQVQNEVQQASSNKADSLYSGA